MSDATRRVMGRFPDYEESIETLSEPGSNFNTLCHEYSEVEDKLNRLESSSEANAEQEARRLRLRRASLEQELLAMMQQTQRV